jgi:ADP-glucose pyrophosphorylase
LFQVRILSQSVPRLICFMFLQNAKIYHSVVGLRSWVAEGAIIEDALLMGADYYEVLKNYPFLL